MADPLVPWIGGKRRLAKHILPLLAVPHTCYVEPFAGAAAIFFAKAPSDVEVLNDINGELVNLYRVVQHHLEEFCRQFKHALVSRQMFEWQKMALPATLTGSSAPRGSSTSKSSASAPAWPAATSARPPPRRRG